MDDVLRVTTACIIKLGDDHEGARACLEALQRCRHPQTGETVFPSTVTYSAAISACEKAARADDALSLFAHLQQHGPDRGVFPNTITYSAAISACEKAGRADDALSLFAHLQQHGAARGVLPNTITYTAAISACEKGNRRGETGRLLDDGITAGIFRPSLGFSAGKNMLDLHENAILISPAPSGRPAGAHPAVARAIFDRLLGQGVIDQTTRFVVGQHGQGSLQAAIDACMRQQGWVPVHPHNAQGRPNIGLLVAAPASASADGTGGTSTGRPAWASIPAPASAAGAGERDSPAPSPAGTQTHRQPLPGGARQADPPGAGSASAISWADKVRRAPASRK
ncbi:pentatricopeptide repeat-containing protein [Paraburkholderia humisilvae]|uniref:pentatricopeptide repeat-containing protein n=1 Tax=Paraburkholderia humisilvae TaxID=627669 RepID=UPI001583A8D1|nr:pentatricopeptide repeat-containing protein [Paraburkholderia humisilvae]